jgi:hypothetical protein
VGLDLTHPMPRSLAVPAGLPLTAWQHSTSVKLSLAGLYRRRFWAASAAGAHDELTRDSRLYSLGLGVGLGLAFWAASAAGAHDDLTL